MKEIYKDLFISDQADYELKVKNQTGWAIVHACKEPYHRQLLGYIGRGAPKNHPEYFFAERGDRLYLNLVDAPNPDFIPIEIIDKTLDYIDSKLKENKKVLVHCNQGMSRSAVIGILFLASINFFTEVGFNEAEKKYRELYPDYNPGKGIREFALRNWDKYCR